MINLFFIMHTFTYFFTYKTSMKIENCLIFLLSNVLTKILYN